MELRIVDRIVVFSPPLVDPLPSPPPCMAHPEDEARLSPQWAHTPNVERPGADQDQMQEGELEEVQGELSSGQMIQVAQDQSNGDNGDRSTSQSRSVNLLRHRSCMDESDEVDQLHGTKRTRFSSSSSANDVERRDEGQDALNREIVQLQQQDQQLAAHLAALMGELECAQRQLAHQSEEGNEGSFESLAMEEEELRKSMREAVNLEVGHLLLADELALFSLTKKDLFNNSATANNEEILAETRAVLLRALTVIRSSYSDNDSSHVT